MPDGQTAKHRTVSILGAGPTNDIPVGRRVHEKSGSFAREALDALDKSYAERLDDQVKAAIEDGLTKLFDRFADEIKEQSSSYSTATGQSPAPETPPPPPTRRGSPLPWVVTAVFGAISVLGAGVTAQDKLQTLEDQQQGLSDRQAKLEEAHGGSGDYDLSVAHYLVVKAADDSANATNLDAMTRLIAAKVGAEVDHIPPPKQTHPPTSVQRKNREFKEARGE